MVASTIARYLERYAEPIAIEFENTIAKQLRRTYQSVLVIPIFAEPLNCLEQVLPADLQQTLVIAIANSAADSDPDAVAQTRAFLQQFNSSGDRAALIPLAGDSDCLMVDFTTAGRQLPAKQGVGLARKIGGDLALACIHHKIVDNTWIHYTDADAQLPLNYFDANPPPTSVAAAIYPFQHFPLHTNILSYEISLRYYVIQLARVNSPYAFQTIGSLLKINACHYARVRGFPKRNAAEDFYMLNKLTKTGQILRLKGPVVRLASRVSQRVPFGTGAAMLKMDQQPVPFELYHPLIFNYLGIWLAAIPALWQDRHRVQTLGLREWWPYDPNILETLSRLKLETVLPQAYRQCRDESRFQKYLWVWFDAFKTLKFIHNLRDTGLAKLSAPEAFSTSGILSQMGKQPSVLEFNRLKEINTELTVMENSLPLVVEPTIP